MIIQDKDSTRTEPFKIYKISDVNIYTDYSLTTAVQNHEVLIKF
jgi:hypothetical protein